jgi:hypothetical protein
MYLAFSLVQESLARLRAYHPFFGITFLVCKQGELPVGRTVHFPINAKEEEFLRTHYKPELKSKHYFTPFKSSARQGRWLSPKYPSSGSQKTRTHGDLADAFMHKRDTDLWGWAKDYVRVLRGQLERDKSGRVPVFWLAVWLFRERSWPENTTADSIVDAFLKEFHISPEEMNEIFQKPLPGELPNVLLSEEPYSDDRLLEIVEPAPDAAPEEGGTLRFLELRGLGPSRHFGFSPAERLSIITGDNGLGKTFLLECAWWALTGHWAEQAAFPRLDASRNEPSITFEIAGKKRKPERETIKYDWDAHGWPAPKGRPTIPGLIVYARVDGSFAVWDPIRHSIDAAAPKPAERQGLYRFTRDQVLTGLEGKIEGLLRDWVKWQHAPDQTVFDTFRSVLRKLAPPEMKTLEPAKPVRLPHEPREIPTLSHTYGDVPFTQESAGIRRIVTLAYLLVWAWNEHKIFASLAKRPPQQKMVILVDEMEAHLHPKWQRVVLPALLDVAGMLSRQVEPQMIIATHSPLVLASIESSFSDASDQLFHLELTPDGAAKFSELPFVRYGRVDAWLTSEIFALRQARSREGEDAIERAKALMAMPAPSAEEIEVVHNALSKALAEDDDFWPRWGYFAERKGLKL